jgi:hypothetical protein
MQKRTEISADYSWKIHFIAADLRIFRTSATNLLATHKIKMVELFVADEWNDQ